MLIGCVQVSVIEKIFLVAVHGGNPLQNFFWGDHIIFIRLILVQERCKKNFGRGSCGEPLAKIF